MNNIFIVMPFGPKNAPVFYTAMTQPLREEWLFLFKETQNQLIIEYFPTTIIYDDKIIMDDILISFNHIPILLYYFFVSIKFLPQNRSLFKLSNCILLKPRVEFVGRDITALGNCSSQSKF